MLGAEKIGVNSYVHSILAYFTMLGALGTASYGSREIARVRDDAYERSKRFWEIELLSVFTSTIATIGWIVFILCVNQMFPYLSKIFY